ncbi:hypothetical protein B0E48_16250 [Rhodanobacter sp. C03]|nr:hypothetical protein B0E48_16250 [Rhodanobacter sp. C03]
MVRDFMVAALLDRHIQTSASMRPSPKGAPAAMIRFRVSYCDCKRGDPPFPPMANEMLDPGVWLTRPEEMRIG